MVKPWLESIDGKIADLQITELELDSRQITDGKTFVAVPGYAVDGRRFIESAVTAGANLVLAQSDDDYPHGSVVWLVQTPVLYLDNLASLLSELAGRLYSTEGLGLIAVTGTNGKTTITQLMAQWLDKLSVRGAVMGTTGNGFLDDLQQAKNTTGSAN